MLVTLPVYSANKNQESLDMESEAVYIIEFTDKPLATYKGDLADFPSTSPSATGKKLDFKHPDIVRYRKRLAQQLSVYLKNIRNKLNREPEVIQKYDVGFFGIAIRLKAKEVLAIKELTGIKQIRPDELRTLLKNHGSMK